MLSSLPSLLLPYPRRSTVPHRCAAGLRYLSTRASTPNTPVVPPSPSSTAAGNGPVLSPSAALAHVVAAEISVLPGLFSTELALAEAALGGV